MTLARLPAPALPHDELSALRVCRANEAPVRREGKFVLYWMIAARRLEWNAALQRAIAWAVELGRPLVIFEPLRIGYRWANSRIHRFIVDGMREHAQQLAKAEYPGVLYYPYLEPTPDADKGLLAALAAEACVVVTDEYPAFFLPRMVASAAARLPVSVEMVDSNGLLPLHATDRVFTTAFSFRAFLQKTLPPYLLELPRKNPFARLKLPPLSKLPTEITRRWPAAQQQLLQGDTAAWRALPIDHSVAPVDLVGGAAAGRKRLHQFLQHDLAGYAERASHPDDDCRSNLSAYLHFGHLSVAEIFSELMRQEDWNPSRLGRQSGGKREGWWGVEPNAESWLDELVTWREIGFNMATHQANYEAYESLPDWAQATLAKHARDPRPQVYSLEQFAAAATHDPLWNAAQQQLLQQGRIHNYLRMLWGKKILEWSPTPQDALQTMIELNNRFALDGRDPNSYSGIFWVLGRYDRPWGPERPIFGTVRYMSSDNTQRKLDVRNYLRQFGGPSGRTQTRLF